MDERGNRHSSGQLIPLVLKGYLFGTLVAAAVLHVAIAIIAPGDAGTMMALGSGIFFIILILFLGVIGGVAFPIAALLSWPLRRLVFEKPAVALVLSCSVGFAIGAILTFTEFQVGPGDFWSGPLVGFVYGLVWFLVVRRSRYSDNHG